MQMGVEVWRSRNSDKKGQVPPPGAAGPCLVPRRGAPNKYGPLQLWSKPQPGGTAAVFIQSTVRQTTNHRPFMIRIDTGMVASDLKVLPSVGHHGIAMSPEGSFVSPFDPLGCCVILPLLLVCS